MVAAASPNEGESMEGTKGSRRDEEIHFYTPGPRGAAFPYEVLAAGRATARPREPVIRRRFNQHVLILTTAGLGHVEVGSRSFDCPPGTIAWLDTSREYGHGCAPSSDGWTYLWFGMRGFGLDAVLDLVHVRSNPILSILCARRLAERFEDVVTRLRLRIGDIESENSAAVGEVIAAIFADRLPDREEPDGRHQSLNILMQRVRMDLGRTWRVADLSKVLGISSSQLHRRFLEGVGATPMDWLRRERMNAAKRLLVQTEAPVRDVAARHGYPDPFHFSREFRRVTGLSPTAFRRSQGN